MRIHLLSGSKLALPGHGTADVADAGVAAITGHDLANGVLGVVRPDDDDDAISD